MEGAVKTALETAFTGHTCNFTVNATDVPATIENNARVTVTVTGTLDGLTVNVVGAYVYMHTA